MRSRQSRLCRSGFTLMELLVVTAIIAVLIALLVPAVQKVRSAAARTQCINNIKQIALATHNYHDANKKFPYAALDYQAGEATASFVSGLILILPYLEQDAVARRWNPKKPRNDTSTEATLGYSNASLQKALIPTYLCPSMTPPSGALPEERAYCSYIFSSGTPDCQLYAYYSFYGIPEPVFDGAIIPLHSPEKTPGTPNGRATSIASITDGASNTFLVGETDFKPMGVPSTTLGAVWAYGYIGYNWGSAFHPFNKHDHTSTPYGAFRSEHTGGGNFAMADGSVQFVSDTIAHSVFRGLATRAGGEIVSIE